ncbi:T9SS type B sorting domain-containing protein, partial [Luteibaculum oceani]
TDYILRVDATKYSLDVPDAFSPNGDGINDEIYPQGWGVESYEEFRVYNRYGELVFTGTPDNPAWDGTVNGEPAAVDTYYFVVRAKMFDKRIREILHGEFRLIR